MAKMAKGTPTPSLMDRPRPVGDPQAELLWRAERLVRKLAKIPVDQVQVPGPPTDSAVPAEWRIKLAKELATACGLSTEMGFRRSKLAFWECFEIATWIHNSFQKPERETARNQFSAVVREGMSVSEKQTIIAP